MSTEVIERVFGRGRQKMVTGDHVEVYREAVAPGERRRYTKRFLATGGADFRQWTDREWRILARLIGHGVRCVPAVVQYHGGAEGGLRELQTYDAGITVDQWATLVPVERDGVRRRNVFADAAHWWALAHHCLAALDEIHALELVHLDVKADNLCIPFGPPDFDPADPAARLTVDFGRLALIDFAFSLVSRERLATSLPIGWQKDYDYQSPRLLHALDAGRDGDLVPTQELDWRCDLYSLAAMLRRYLPDDASPGSEADPDGWTPRRRDDARALVLRLRECHDGDDVVHRPHRALMDLTVAHVGDPDLARSIAAGWTLVHDPAFLGERTWVTPLTRIAGLPAAPTRLTRVRTTAIAMPREMPTVFRDPRSRTPDAPLAVPMTAVRIPAPAPARRSPRVVLLAAAIVAIVSMPFLGDAATPLLAAARDGWTLVRSLPDLVATRPASEPPAHPSGAVAHAPIPAQPLGTTPGEPATTRDNPPVAPSLAQGSAEERRTEALEAKARPATDESAEGARTASVTAPAGALPPAANANTGPRPGAGKTSTRVAAIPPSPRPETRASVAPPSGGAASASERNAKSRAAGSAPATGQERTPASPNDFLAPPVTPTPYDPVAARRATTRLAQQAMRGSSTHAAASEASSKDATRVPPASDVVASAAREPQAVAVPKSDPEPVAARAEQAKPPSVQADVAASTTIPGPAANAGAARPDPWRAAESSAIARSPESAPPRNRWRDRWQSALRALGLGTQSAAPVEERRLPPSVASTAPGPNASRPGVASAPAWSSDARAATPAPSIDASSGRTMLASRDDVPVFASDAGRVPAPSAMPPRYARSGADGEDDLATRGRRIVAETVPVVAAQASADAAIPLGLASSAAPSRSSGTFANATNVRWRSEASAVPTPADAYRARELYDAAHRAYTAGRKAEAIELDLRALAANPRDPDVAGFLAFLHLRTTPARPETARQLALHALAFSGSRRGTRFEDWNTFAVASALTGRTADATRTYLLMLGLSGDAERSCRAALRAQAAFGDALRPSVEALSQRIRRDGRGDEAPGCATIS